MRIMNVQTPHKSKKRRMRADVDMGVIHYTGSMSLSGTLDWFGDNRSKVSAHYLIGREGEVYQYEDLTAILWHAGKSVWQGRKWCNGRSIGYELVGTFESGFSEAQMDVLIELLYTNASETDMRFIVGHEHISPGRKVDPGPKFNWDLIRASHRETPFMSFSSEPIQHIGAYPISPPKQKIEIESGEDGKFSFFTPTSERILRLLRIQGRNADSLST